MKMCDDPIHHDLVDHTLILNDALCEPKFCNCRWLNYFLQLQAFNEGIGLEFSQIVRNDQLVVKGLIIALTNERIAQVIGFLVVGENYPKGHDARLAMVKFTVPNYPPLCVSRQETKILSFPKGWAAKLLYIIIYLTYEG